MKIALDPYMFRSTPLLQLPGLVAELGFDYIELSPREDFMPFFLMPRCDDSTVRAFKKALDGAGVKVAANLPLYRWAGPDEDERRAAVRYWKRAIQITTQLDCDVMNSEFNGRPEQASLSEAQFWRSMEELLPVFELEVEVGRLELAAGDRGDVDSVIVVLGGDLHLAGDDVLDRGVGAVVTVFALEGAPPDRQPQELVA